MEGKKTCSALKQIRKQIADANDIKYEIEECKYQGECSGTCPKCEGEARYIERELMRRQKLGKAVVIAGLATTLTVCSGFSCGNGRVGFDVQGKVARVVPEDSLNSVSGNHLQGDVAVAAPDGDTISAPACNSSN